MLFILPEDDVAQVQRQMATGALAVQAYDRTNTQLIAAGTLATTDNQIDSTMGTVKLRANFSNTGNALFPQQFVNARLLVQTLKGMVVAPQGRCRRGRRCRSSISSSVAAPSRSRRSRPAPARTGWRRSSTG